VGIIIKRLKKKGEFMSTLKLNGNIVESPLTDFEKKMKKESNTERVRKISKEKFLVGLYLGTNGISEPITDIATLSLKVKEAEEKGLFRVRSEIKRDRDSKKYIDEVKWYLTQAAKKGLIDREYKPRKKQEPSI
jgi:hypothetical protein